MKKKLLAFFLILGLVLTQAASLSALAEESPSEEPLVTVETETPVEDSSANGGDDISVLSVADGGEVLEEAVQEGPVVTSADSAEPAFLGEPATQSSTDPETSFFGVLITDADGNGNASGSSYMMFYPGMEGESSRTSASNNFVENGGSVFLQAYPADGYKFLGWYQGDPDKADGKLYTGEPLMLDRTYKFTAPIGLERPYVCAVFDVDDSPQADQVQMWVGNIVATPGGASAQGGKVAVKYTPSYDVYPDIKAKDGTNFVYGDVLQFYKGDECTVYQQPDPGYRFVGWYHANVENIGGLFYEGDPISTEDTFTYKPGKTVVPGDTEPLRYVCAVFEEEEAATVYLCTGRSDGGTFKVQTGDVIYDDAQMNNMALDGGSPVVMTATPAEGYEFVGYYEGIRQMDPDQDGYGFVTDYDPDKLIYADSNYSFTIAENTNIYALFREKPATVTVTFDAQGGTPVPEPQIVASGGKASMPVEPLREGWGFRGWYTDKVYTEDNKFDFDTPVTEDMTLYAGWAKVHMLIPYDITKKDSGGGAISYDGSDPVAGSIFMFTAFDGETHTLAATPNEGYEFVGWSTSNSEDDVFSTDAEYTYESKDAGDWFALFKEKTTTVTVTFDAKGGTPEPAAQIIENGGKPTEPAEPEKAGWNFRGWCTDSACTEASLYFRGDSDDPITSDITLYARWQKYIMLQTYDLTNASFTAGGSSIAYLTCDYDSAGAAAAYFSIVENDNVKFTGTAEEGYRFVGWSTSTSNDDVISDDNLYEFTVAVDSPSKLYALFEEETPTLTLHWSSIDGVDLADPIVIENIEKGTKVYEALGTIGLNMMSHPFEKEGYIASDYKVKKPITEYADRASMEADEVDGSAPIESNMDIYCIMMKAVDTVEVTVDTPVCGTIITAPPTEGYPWSQADPPSVSIPDGAGYKPYIAYDGASPAIWVNSVPDYEPFEGKIIGGEEHAAQIWLDTDFGYIFPDDVGITVNGGTPVEKIRTPGSLAIIASVTAVHDPAEAVEENPVEATCTEAGSYDEVVYCKGCGAELYRETKEIPALGHAWGEWIVDKEATEEEAGHRYHVCSRCGEEEGEEIPMIVATYGVAEGDGAIWYTGSNDSLTFTFKRSVNDEKTFDLFQRIEIDGKEVASTNYEAKAGSVIITLKPEYIKTLAVGKHTLTAVFENGKTADATFTIAEKKADVVPGGDTAKKGTGVKTGDNANTVLYMGLSVAALLIIAVTLILMKRRSRHEQ